MDVSGLHVVNRLDVDKDVSLNKNVEIADNLVVNNYIIAKSDISVNFHLDTNTLAVVDRLDVSHDASFNMDVEIMNNLLVNNNINIINKLDVSGVYIHNGLIVNDDSSFNENLYINKDLRIKNDLIVHNDVSFINHLDVSSIFIKNNLIVDDDVSLNKNLFFNNVLRDRTVLEPYLTNLGITDDGIDDYFENNIRVLKLDTETKKVYFGEVDFSGSDIRVTIDGIITDYIREKYINIDKDASFNSDVSFIKNIEISNNLIVKKESHLHSKSYFYDDIYLKTNDYSGTKFIYGPEIIGLDPYPHTGGSANDGNKGTVIIYGDLRVLGTTTTVESSELIVKDRLIRVETAPGLASGLEIWEINRANLDNSATMVGTFTFINKGDQVEWSTYDKNLTIGDGIFTASQIKAKSYGEKVHILDIFSHDISCTNIETSHLKLMDLSARNISDFSMIGDLNINNNNIKNVTSISANQNNGYIRFNDPLYLSAGKDILMNNNSILRINRLQGYSSLNNNSSTYLVIDSRTIDINNNNLINVNRITGFPITLNPGTESNILKINDLEFIDKDISGVDKLYGKVIDANGNRSISVINDMSLTKITLQEISGNSNVLSINNLKNGRSVEITAPETKIDASNIYVMADTVNGSINMKAQNININDQTDARGVMNIGNFLNINFLSQINIGNESAPYRANMYGVVNFLNNSNNLIDICNTAINYFKPIVMHDTNIEITGDGVFKGYLNGNTYNAERLNGEDASFYQEASKAVTINNIINHHAGSSEISKRIGMGGEISNGMTFYWSDNFPQNITSTFVLGSTNNPSDSNIQWKPYRTGNLRVAHADNATNSDIADEARTVLKDNNIAITFGSEIQSNNISPTYVWGNINNSNNQFLYSTAHLNVSRAANANSADTLNGLAANELEVKKAGNSSKLNNKSEGELNVNTAQRARNANSADTLNGLAANELTVSHAATATSLTGGSSNATTLNNKPEGQLRVEYATSAGSANYATNAAKLGNTPAGDLQVGKANRLAEIENNTPHVNTFLANHIWSKNDVVAYYSDERLKEKLGKIENAIDKIKAIETFYFKENEKASEFGFNKKERQLGVSAQSVKAVVPEVISLAAFDRMDISLNGVKQTVSNSGENYLSVDYSKLVTLLIEGIKEQQKQIDELKNEIITLKTN